MQETPKANRIHIALFGNRNVGKSSIINALTNQQVAIVSPVAGTTTDPVQKAMELLPLGPVVFIDTAGLDDVGELGQMRIEKSLQVIDTADMILLILDTEILSDKQKTILDAAKLRKIPVIIVLNKIDEHVYDIKECNHLKDYAIVQTSAQTGAGIDLLKSAIVDNAPLSLDEISVLDDLIQKDDVVLFVIPIDTAAPKGRLILPQVQILRDALDNYTINIVVKETQLQQALDKITPKLVITDSQIFKQVSKIVPKNINLTSFSILYARYKGDLSTLVQGAAAIENLKDGDKVLIAEACTHHQTQDDIGTVKIPKLLNNYVGGKIDFSFSHGLIFKEDLSKYKLIIHCGSCMITRKQMLSRIMQANKANIPIVNYGIAIAYLNGILTRVLSPFPEYQKNLKHKI